MRIMGIDWGEVRVGIALSDPLGMTAQPKDHLKNDVELMRNIIEFARSKDVGKIVIGLPKSMNGTLGSSAAKVESLQKALSADIDIPVILWDERLTTKMAQRTMSEMGLKAKKQKAMIDSSSAALMLQNYMDANKK